MILLISTFTIFIFDNISEIKTLMPLVVLESYTKTFKSNLEVKFELKNYGDSCLNDNSYIKTKFSSVYCNKDIYAHVENINFESNSLRCYKDKDNTCVIVYYCSQCEITLDSSIKLALIEKLSFSAGILVNITSESSVPESPSSVSLGISPETGKIFIGPTSNDFFFTMTPSYFTSSVSEFPSKTTGYHITSESSPKVGSQNFIQDISLATQLSINVFFLKTSTGLYTSRYQRQSFLIFISGLFGTLSGLVGFIRFFMCQFEDWSKRKRNLWVGTSKLELVIENEAICRMNFNLRGNYENLENILNRKAQEKSAENTAFNVQFQSNLLYKSSPDS